MNVAIAVPRRADGGRRDEVWAWCRQWWETNTPWPIHEGFHETDGKFNAAAARNRAAAAAGDDWDVLFLLDADVILADPAQAFRAVETAARTGRWTAAHDRWRSLTRVGSDRIMAGWAGDWGTHVRTTLPMSFANAIAVPRDLWEAVKGQDERHVGWGWEDISFMMACKALGGGIERVHGDVFHLWHPRSAERAEEQPEFSANRVLCKRTYRPAERDPDAMRRVLADAIGWKDHP